MEVDPPWLLCRVLMTGSGNLAFNVTNSLMSLCFLTGISYLHVCMKLKLILMVNCIRQTF